MALTARESAVYIDRKGLLNVVKGKLGVSINCTDARENWGRVDVKVTPINGTGETWVSESRIAWEK